MDRAPSTPRTVGNGPLLEASSDGSTAWGVGLSVRCGCDTSVRMIDKHCPGCGAKNMIALLLRKRRRLDRWIRRSIDVRLLDQLDEADEIPEAVRRFEKKLGQIVRHPLPEKQRGEDTGSYLSRSLEFMAYMLENSSPAQVAQEIEGRLRSSAHTLSQIAEDGVIHIVSSGTGETLRPASEAAVSEHARRVVDVLGELLVPYLEALKSLKIYHERMVKAWLEARPLLARPLPAGKLSSAWAKVRGSVNPVGPLLRFGVAVWKNQEERKKLQRLETEISRFHEQVERFGTQSTSLDKRRRELRKRWRVSLTRHIARRLREHIAEADQVSRQQMVERLLVRASGNGWLRRLRRLRSTRPTLAAHG